MFKDKVKQKEANREANKAYRERKKGITQGITKGITDGKGITVGITDKSFAEHFHPAPKNLKGAKVTLDGYHEITFTLVNAIYREAEGKAMLSGMPVEDWCRRLVLHACKRK